jgi:hypothetical protein
MTDLQALKKISNIYHHMDVMDASGYDRRICKILIAQGVLKIGEYIHFDGADYKQYESIK